MRVSFFRKYPLEINIQNKIELFELIIGLSAPIDPQSGMSANLPEMDKISLHAISEVSQKRYNSAEECLTQIKKLTHFKEQISRIELLKINSVEHNGHAWIESFSEGKRSLYNPVFDTAISLDVSE